MSIARTGGAERAMVYHSRPLLPLALIWLITGWRVLTMPAPDRDYLVLVEHLPVWVRVALWWGPALCAIVAAWWPAGRPQWGYVALIMPAALRATSYTVATPWRPELADDAATWVAICWVVVLFATGSAHASTLYRQTGRGVGGGSR